MSLFGASERRKRKHSEQRARHREERQNSAVGQNELKKKKKEQGKMNSRGTQRVEDRLESSSGQWRKSDSTDCQTQPHNKKSKLGPGQCRGQSYVEGNLKFR